MESFSMTDIGRQREINQDSIYCNNDSIGILPNLYIVADGMGGHKAGDFASSFCIHEFVKELSEGSGRTMIGSMEGALRNTNEKLLKQAADNPEYEGMGTTFVAAVVAGHSVLVANVGDSRLYLISKKEKEEQIRQITEDHSLVEEMIRKGEIERKDAKYHPKKNVITRALGAAEQVIPDFFEIEAETGAYLLLCSDGLTNMLEDEVIKAVVLEDEVSLERKTKKLIGLANEQGGKDNISVILVRL